MEKRKNVLIDVLIDVVSGLLMTLAIYCFAVPANFPMSGVSGVALVFYRLLGWPVGIMIMVLNIPIALLCYRTLGRAFYLKSLKSIVITSAIMDVLGPRCVQYQGDLLLAAICSGVLCGVAYGLIFMRNSSTGGTDFIIMTIRYYHPHLSVGRIALVMDMVIIAAGGALIGNIDAVIYGMILAYLSSVMLDKVVYGTNGKLTMIVTDEPEKMVRTVDQVAGRGATILKAQGGYSGEEKGVVLCASSSKEMFTIRKSALEADEHAFVIILDSHDVIGEGFRAPDQLDEL
jgi:uncharacterized membrane-anchored protein YitT (DUF2179 family)